MQQKKCYIFGAGEYEGTTFPTIEAGALVIAADGGLTALQQQGITPDIILGDFDSYPAVPPQTQSTEVLVYPVEKDDTDMLLAAKYGLKNGCQRFYLYGGIGGRLDHTLANIQMLAWLSHQGAKGFLYGNNTILTAITNDTLEFPGANEKNNQKTRLSVFCYGETAEGVTIKGCKYNVENATWDNQYPIGVSNMLTGQPARITVKRGTLLIYQEVVQQ